MAHRIYNNKKLGSVNINVNTSNSEIKITGNTSVSNIALTDEVVVGGTLTRVIVGGEATGHVKISSGNASSNTLLGWFGGNYDYNLKDGMGITLTGDSLFVDVSGSNTSVILEVKKQFNS